MDVSARPQGRTEMFDWVSGSVRGDATAGYAVRIARGAVIDPQAVDATRTRG